LSVRLILYEKGIYSIEKFLIARRLMYWQVYFHKTVIAAEQLLLQILKRAKYLVTNGEHLFASPSFDFLLRNNPSPSDFIGDERFLDAFSNIDDNDIYTSIKVWASQSDKVLACLCQELISRRLYAIEIENEPIPATKYEEKQKEWKVKWNLSDDESKVGIGDKQDAVQGLLGMAAFQSDDRYNECDFGGSSGLCCIRKINLDNFCIKTVE
jgi:HD superfamily phosphohydrolase